MIWGGAGAWIAGLALCYTFCRLANNFVPSVEGVVTESALLLALAVLALLAKRQGELENRVERQCVFGPRRLDVRVAQFLE